VAYGENKESVESELESMQEVITRMQIDDRDLADRIEQSKVEFKEYENEQRRIIEKIHDDLTYLKEKRKYIQRQLDDAKGFQEIVNQWFEKVQFKIQSQGDKFDKAYENLRLTVNSNQFLSEKGLSDLTDTTV